MPTRRPTPLVPALVALAVALLAAGCSTAVVSPSPTGGSPVTASSAPQGSPSSASSVPASIVRPAPGAPSSSSPTASGVPSGVPSVTPSIVPSRPVGSSAQPSGQIPASPPAGITVHLPVVTCTVTDGAIQGPLPTPMVTSLDVVVPAALASRLVVYGVENEQLILGPRDWRCTGLIGADASSHVTIIDPADSTTGIVVERAPGAPYSGVLDLACPLFPAANDLLQSTFGFDCPKRHVAAEQVTMQTPEIARFMDPPGVKAVGALSGGAVPVRGALLFHTASDNTMLALQISCALPESDAAICATVVDDWLDRVTAAYDIPR